MGAPTLVKVKAVRDFNNGHAGAREKDEQFLYDVAGDPGRLIADGFVIEVKAAKGAGGAE